jgi:hypothetical protein
MALEGVEEVAAAGNEVVDIHFSEWAQSVDKDRTKEWIASVLKAGCFVGFHFCTCSTLTLVVQVLAKGDVHCQEHLEGMSKDEFKSLIQSPGQRAFVNKLIAAANVSVEGNGAQVQAAQQVSLFSVMPFLYVFALHVVHCIQEQNWKAIAGQDQLFASYAQLQGMTGKGVVNTPVFV